VTPLRDRERSVSVTSLGRRHRPLDSWAEAEAAREGHCCWLDGERRGRAVTALRGRDGIQDPGSSRPGRPIWLGWTSVDGPIGAERHVLGPVTLSVCVCVTSAADAEWTCRLLGPSAIVHEPTAFRSPLRPTRPDQEWHGPPSALASDSDPRWSVAGAIKLC